MINISQVRRHRWFVLFVAVPVLLASIYYGLVASDIYMSESRFVVRSPGQRAPQSSSLANLIQTTGFSMGHEETNEIVDYIRSRNALKDVNQNSNLAAKYSLASVDRLSRYPLLFRTAAFENLYRYYNSMVDARLDNVTDVAVLNVEAFSARDAHDINVQLLDLSEQLVNRLNDRATAKGIMEAERRVGDAQLQARSARLALGSYRNRAEIIDPGKQASGALSVSNGLLGEQAALQAQLNLMRKVTPRHPSLAALQGRINAIASQVAIQTGRVVGTPSGIASKMGAYENLELDQQLATEKLKASVASLEQARADAQKQQFYLERVVEPNTPDLGLYPNRLKNILTVAGIAFCLYFIGWMLVAGILEHAPED
jgi:capsular polysaccharide transport system permease protein